MNIRPMVPGRRKNRCANAAAHDPHEVRQSRCRRNPVSRQSRQRDRHERDEEPSHADALDHRGQHQREGIDAGGIARAHPEHEREDEERDGCDLARIDARQELADDRREQDREQSDWREHEAGVGRGVADIGLQPQRQQHEIAEVEPVADRERDRAAREIAQLEERQVDDRMLRRQFPHDEERQRDHRDQRQHHDGGGIEPVEILALVEHDLQRADPDHEQPETHGIDRRLADHRIAVAEDRERGNGRDETHRNVDVENPRPRDVVRDPAAQNRSGDRRDQRGHRPHGERHGRLRAWITREQQGLRQRDHRAGDRALQHARGEQEGQRRRESAQPRSDHEQHDRRHEQAHLSEALREPAGQRHRDRIGDRERRDHPRALIRRYPEVTGDRRNGHVGNRRIEHVHEHRERNRDRADHEFRAL